MTRLGLLRAACGLLGAWCLAPVMADSAACGSLDNGYGPFDYRSQRSKLAIVERFHFTPDVEALIRGGKSANSLGSNLDYTLRASPNHHRALAALARLAEREKLPQIAGMRYSVDCWFERAVRFSPDDTIASLLMVSYLSRTGRTDAALARLQVAAEAAKDNGFTHYNVGLGYLQLKKYDEALQHAHRAVHLGFSGQELKKQLQAVGHWREPTPEKAPAAVYE
jgi:tetratricopeptide (TPR) repeat protein